MTFGSLFAGIGGFDLGLERAGMKCVWQVEKDDFCNKVLEKHWPEVRRHRDVKECGKSNLDPVDLICGGFPCQPHSKAGKRRGENDDRNLWPEFARILSELSPTWALIENVLGIRDTMLDKVLSDLEDMGYETWQAVIPACAFDAGHKRDRVWVVAYSVGNEHIGPVDGVDGQENEIQETKREKDPESRKSGGAGQVRWTGHGHESIRPGWGHGSRWPVEPGVDRVVNGVPDGMDRLKSLGNAVVPQVVEFLGRLIMGEL